MKIVFRADASLLMGSGHIMRCLTLADALKAEGADCHFICREHKGNLIEHVQRSGYRVHRLIATHELALLSPHVLAVDMDEHRPTQQPVHAHWLGGSQQQDVAACEPILREIQPDWLIVDHYALDTSWETAVKVHCRKLMVIDDLADRRHACQLLLDQTFGRSMEDYKNCVPAHTIVLCGSQYALLRPEFAALRQYSLERRATAEVKHLLVSMGGVDNDNATGQVLQALKTFELPANCKITVVMGSSAPWLADVRQQAASLPWPTDVRVNVSNMAQLMADSDLAIGAAGSSTWERCCLGLPSVMVVLADNQRQVALGLEWTGAVNVLSHSQQILERLPALLTPLVTSSFRRAEMTHKATEISDGSGLTAVKQHMELSCQ